MTAEQMAEIQRLKPRSSPKSNSPNGRATAISATLIIWDCGLIEVQPMWSANSLPVWKVSESEGEDVALLEPFAPRAEMMTPNDSGDKFKQMAQRGQGIGSWSYVVGYLPYSVPASGSNTLCQRNSSWKISHYESGPAWF